MFLHIPGVLGTLPVIIPETIAFRFFEMQACSMARGPRAVRNQVSHLRGSGITRARLLFFPGVPGTIRAVSGTPCQCFRDPHVKRKECLKYIFVHIHCLSVRRNLDNNASSRFLSLKCSKQYSCKQPDGWTNKYYCSIM